MKITGKLDMTVFHGMAMMTSDDPIWHKIRSVQIEVKDGKATWCATDGRAMLILKDSPSVILTSGSVTETEPKEFKLALPIPNFSIFGFNRIIKRPQISFSFENDATTFSANGISQEIKNPNTFPNWRMVLPKTGEEQKEIKLHAVTFNPYFMDKVKKAVDKITGLDLKGYTLEFCDTVLLFYPAETNLKIFALVMPTQPDKLNSKSSKISEFINELRIAEPNQQQEQPKETNESDADKNNAA